MRELENLKELYLDEIKKINKKGELSPADAEAAKKALEAIQMIDDICCNEDDDRGDTYQRRMPEMHMDRRGRSSMTGRYISRHSGNTVDGMIRKLENLKMDAPDADTKMAIDHVIERLEVY